MSPPRHISYSPLLPTTGPRVHTSSKPSEAYHYYRSPCPHLAIYLILYYYLLQVYRSTRRQNPQKHTITTCHHVPTSPCLILYLTLLQVHRSTRRQSPKNHTLLQINMSPPRHISHSLLLPTTGLQVNTSSKLSEAYQYHRSPCHHLAIYLILYYYLLQVYRSTHRQNPQNQSITTGNHVPTSPYISFSTTTYYRSTGQHVVKTPRIILLLQVTMSPPHHISFSTTTYYRSTGQHVVKTSRTLRIIPIPQVTMSPPHHIAYSLIRLFSSSKPSQTYHYYRSPCHHLTIYPYLFYYLLQVYRSTCRQNIRKHTNTTGHHVTTSPCILFSTTTYYRFTGQHVFKTLRSIPSLQVTMSPPRHISHYLLHVTT